MQYSATVDLLALNRCFRYDDRLTVSFGLFSCLVLTCVPARLVTADDGCADGARKISWASIGRTTRRKLR